MKRFFCSTSSLNKIKNSTDWASRQEKDQFVKKARSEDYRARSAYKLIEIQAKYKLIQPDSVVVECGGAPGAWTQVLASIAGRKGKIVSCDLLGIEPVEGATTLSHMDFTTMQSQQTIIQHLDGRKVDCVVSDMSPNLSGNTQLDQDRITNLVYSVIRFALTTSARDARLLTKVFFGTNSDRMYNDLTKFYRKVDFVKPSSSRKESAEIYLLARNFVGVK